MKFSALIFSLSLLSLAGTAHAQTPAQTPADEPAKPAVTPDHWRLLFSPYALHYTHSTEHRPVWGIGLERQRADSYVYGLAFISNSFGQETGYFFGGQRLRNFSHYDKLYAQWTAGLLYGYKRQYADKVPFNHNGYSPGVVLTAGWQFTPKYGMSLNVLGNSALMLQMSAELD
jgi:hypothetical protein